MKYIKLTTKQRLSILIPAICIVITFLFVSKSFFNNRELRILTDICFEQNGDPIIETTYFNLNYSFTCKK